MMLNSTIKMAIESFSCSTEVAPLSAPQNSASSSETQTSSAVSSTGVIAGFVIVAVLIILVLVILIFRTYQEKVSLKGMGEIYLLFMNGKNEIISSIP